MLDNTRFCGKSQRILKRTANIIFTVFLKPETAILTIHFEIIDFKPPFMLYCSEISIKNERFVIISGEFLLVDTKFLASSQKKIRAFFAGEFEKFGYSYESLNWESQISQYARFEVLLSIGEFEGKKLLDVGCGLGDLLKYIKLNKKKVA